MNLEMTSMTNSGNALNDVLVSLDSVIKKPCKNSEFITSFVFSLRELVKLELRECQIESISVKAFVGLTKLEWLAMDKNFLTTISHFSFLPLANINGLDIHQNPWNCTCNMKPFIQVGRQPLAFSFFSLNYSFHT